LFEQLDKRNQLIKEESFVIKKELNDLEFAGRGSRSKAQSNEITRLIKECQRDKKIIEDMKKESIIIQKDYDQKIELMNEELAEFDMCKLRVRDLELVINKWRTEVKNILDNPIISKTNKLVECKENYLNMILNKIQTKVVEKVSKDEAVLINTNYLKVINKINNLKNRFLYINQKILEDILNTENDIAMTKQIIDNLKNKVLYDKDIKLFRKPISKNLLNKIIYDGYDVSGLKDNNETDIQLYNYKKTIKNK